MWKKIIEALKKAGIITGENETAANEALKGLKLDDPKPPAVDTSKLAPEVKAVFDQMQEQIAATNQANADLLKALNDEKSSRDAAVKQQLEKADREKKEAADKAVADAVAKGLFPEAKREAMLKMAQADLDNFNEFIKDLKPDPRFKDEGGAEDKDKKPGPRSPLDGVDAGILDSVKKYSN